MGRPDGYWQGAVKPELERKVEQQLLSQALMEKKPIHPTPDPTGCSESCPPPRFSYWGDHEEN